MSMYSGAPTIFFYGFLINFLFYLFAIINKAKDDTPKENTLNPNLSNEELRQMLRVQGDFSNRKRSSTEPDDSGAAKRPDNKVRKRLELLC